MKWDRSMAPFVNTDAARLEVELALPIRLPKRGFTLRSHPQGTD